MYIESFTLKSAEEGLSGLYVLKTQKCNRKNCRKCPHGPYLYQRTYRKRGGCKEYYVGKEGTEKERKVMAARLSQETGVPWSDDIPF